MTWFIYYVWHLKNLIEGLGRKLFIVCYSPYIENISINRLYFHQYIVNPLRFFLMLFRNKNYHSTQFVSFAKVKEVQEDKLTS